MSGSDGVDGLSAAIVNVARLMRHDGIRLAVSTQVWCCASMWRCGGVGCCVVLCVHMAVWWGRMLCGVVRPSGGVVG